MWFELYSTNNAASCKTLVKAAILILIFQGSQRLIVLPWFHEPLCDAYDLCKARKAIHPDSPQRLHQVIRPELVIIQSRPIVLGRQSSNFSCEIRTFRVRIGNQIRQQGPSICAIAILYLRINRSFTSFIIFSSIPSPPVPLPRKLLRISLSHQHGRDISFITTFLQHLLFIAEQIATAAGGSENSTETRKLFHRKSVSLWIESPGCKYISINVFNTNVVTSSKSRSR